MADMLWHRRQLDLALDGIMAAIKETRMGTLRYKVLFGMFDALGKAALEERPFKIHIEPSVEKQKDRDDAFQRVVDQVRERRISERSKQK